MPITLRNQKGTTLTFAELDGNFTDLDARSAISYVADSGNNLLYADGTYDFGSNIIKYANVVNEESDLSNYDPGVYHGMVMHVHSTGGLYYAHAGAWRKLLTDVSHNNVEGAGYTNPLSDVAYDGNYSSLANTPNIPTTILDLGISDGTNGQVLSTDGSGNFTFIDEPTFVSSLNDLTDVSVSAATSGQVLKYDGSNWVPSADLQGDSETGILLSDLTVNVLTAGNADLSYDNTSGVFSYVPPDLSSYALSSSIPTTILDLGISDGTNGQVLSTDGSGNFTFIDNSSASGINTIVEDSTPQLGGDLDVNGNSILHIFSITNNGTSAYTFSDAGNHWFPSSEDNPVLYLRRGETYVFSINAVGHPFQILDSASGSEYNIGVTNNGSENGAVEFRVSMSTPSTLYYQCSIHSVMGNTINIV